MGHNKNCTILRNRFKCEYCEKSFMMEWARNKCQRKCKEKAKTIKNG